MLMVFLLMVLVDGEPEPTAGMYFGNIDRCNFFADKIERGHYTPGRYYRGQYNISAYCTPRMVPQETKLWD